MIWRPPSESFQQSVVIRDDVGGDLSTRDLTHVPCQLEVADDDTLRVAYTVMVDALEPDRVARFFARNYSGRWSFADLGAGLTLFTKIELDASINAYFATDGQDVVDLFHIGDSGPFQADSCDLGGGRRISGHDLAQHVQRDADSL